MLNKGEVVEFDAPAELLSRPGGHFASMAPLSCKSDICCLAALEPIGLWPRKETMPEKFTKASL